MAVRQAPERLCTGERDSIRCFYNILPHAVNVYLPDSYGLGC